MHAKFGEPHSLQRSIEFGIIAGLLAAFIAVILGVSLPLVAILTGGVAGWLAGHGRNERAGVSSSARNMPIFATIFAVVIAFFTLAVTTCGGIRLPAPGTQQQSGPLR